MCAFMTPVLRNDWEVYATRKSRQGSESSQRDSIDGSRSKSGMIRKQRGLGTAGRSQSYHVPPRNHSELMYVQGQHKSYHLSTRNSRNTSRNSISTSGFTSPTRPEVQQTEQTDQKPPSSPSLSKFHSKLLDKLKNALTRKSSSSEEGEDGGKKSDDSASPKDKS